MTSTTPPLVVAASLPDRAFADAVISRLAERGMDVALLTDDSASRRSDDGQDPIAACAVVLLVVSPTALSPGTVLASYQQALTLAKPVIPLLVQAAAPLPPDLSERQWVDFRDGLESGMRDLLVTLDLLHLLPSNTTWLDWELALGRAYAGFVPADWTVFRCFGQSLSEIGTNSLIAAAIAVVLSTGALVLSHFNPLYPVFGLVLGMTFFLRFRRNLRFTERYGTILVVTPEGFVQHGSARELTNPASGKTSQPATTFVFQFGETRHIAQRISGDGTLLLTITPADGRPPTTLPVAKGFGAITVIAQTIVTAHQAYLERRGAFSEPTPVPTPSPIFISYSHADGAYADVAEIELRQQGYAPWLDRSQLFGSMQWQQALRDAISQSAAVVVLLSPASMRSPVVQQEYAYALELGKPVIAVVVHGTRRMPRELRSRIAADYRQNIVSGQVHLLLALANLGIATRPTTLRPRRDVLTVVGRALWGTTATGERAFRGRISPRNVVGVCMLAVLIVVLPVVALLVVPQQVGVGIFLAALITLITGVVYARALLLSITQLPELIVTIPDGVVHCFDNRPRFLDYAVIETLHLSSSGWFGSEIRYTLRHTRLAAKFVIDRRFRAHKAIAGQIVADFRQYRDHSQSN